jgi:hypothetical protein
MRGTSNTTSFHPLELVRSSRVSATDLAPARLGDGRRCATARRTKRRTVAAVPRRGQPGIGRGEGRARAAASVWAVLLVSTATVAQTTGYEGLRYGDERIPGRSFGACVAFVGDVDGDGTADFVAGDPGAGGAAFFGRGGFRLCSGATGATLTERFGATAEERLGFAVAGLGDVDDDGVPDFAVSAPGRPPGGAVDVYSGATATILRTLAGSTTFFGTFFVASKSEGLGASLANIGDYDGDGVPDLAAGADEYSPPGSISFIQDVGRVRVFAGADGSVLATFVGAVQWDRFGAAVASLGDLDGDGRPEIAVGAPQTNNPVGGGYVSAFVGGTGAPLTTIVAPGPGFGSRIACVGDVDGDGFFDAFVGSSAVAATGRVYSGATGGLLLTLSGGVGAPAGDVDGDGKADIFVGDPAFAAGGVPGSGRVELVRGSNGTMLRSWIGGGAAALGAAIAFGADLDADGVDDALFGAPSTEGAGGSVDVVSGSDGTTLRTTTVPPPVMPPWLDVWKGLGAGRADVDGDGVDDVLLCLRGTIPIGSYMSFDVGEIRAISGADGTELVRAQAPASVVGGISNWSAYASDATWLRDIDGDGVPDFAVTAPGSGAGGLIVQSGATGAPIVARDETSLGLDLSLASLVSPGDLDGDGIDDILVACRYVFGSSLGASPTVTAVSGANASKLWSAAPVVGATSGLGFGSRVSPLGDVNGDGVPDFATTDFGATIQGQAEIRSGSDGSILSTRTGPPNEIPVSITGVGDLDGDFIHDFATAWIDVSTLVSRIEAWSGSSGTSLWTRFTGQSNDLFGFPLVFVGDVDGDGLGDVATGASNAVVGGTSNAGRLHVLSGASGASIFEADGWADAGVGGDGDGVQFGRALAPIGDRDGDGSPEIAVLAPGAETTPCATTWSWTGVPGGSVRYGTAPPGFLGRVPSIATVGGAFDASVGNPAAGIALTNVRGGMAATLVLGFSSTTWSGGPLPMDLTPFGISGVSLLASPDAIVATYVGGSSADLGARFLSIPLPANPALSGFTTYAQWFVDEPTAAPIPLRATGGLQLVVQ